MRVDNLGFQQVSFGNALSTRQEEEQKKLIKEVRHALGHDGAISVGKGYAQGLPSQASQDTGVGKINSPESFRMNELLQVYAGATAVKPSFPIGQLGLRPAYNDKGYYGSYQRSTLTIGEDMINPFNLTKPEYGSILPESEAQKVVARHAKSGVSDNQIDYDNELGKKAPDQYPINETLKVAYKNFKEMEATPELEQLRNEFDAYKSQKEPVDIDGLRKELFSGEKDLTNLEYAKKALELRNALIERDGVDIFVGRGSKLTPTDDDYEAAQRVADGFQQCIDVAQGDSEIFTRELMRITEDVAPHKINPKIRR